MKQFFINKNSEKLLIFFSGWGCDEYEFEGLETDCDVLIFYDYTDLSYDFDFSKYTEINLLSFSAGVFIGSIFEYNFKVNKMVVISGNPYLFDEDLGLSKDMQNYLYNLTEDDFEQFIKDYLVKTEEEYKNFHPSKRTLSSCQNELDELKKIYIQKFDKIVDSYDRAIIGAQDTIFNFYNQKKYYGNRGKIIPDARHNMFFRIESYNDILNLKL